MNPIITYPPSVEQNPLRALYITSTDTATLHGYNRYQSLSALWNCKKAGVTAFRKKTDAMQYGNDNQDRIAWEVCQQMGWRARPAPEFYSLPDKRAATSLDWIRLDRPGIIEVKTIQFFMLPKGWVAVGNNLIQASMYVEFQIQHQMWVTGQPEGWIVVEVYQPGDPEWTRKKYIGHRLADPRMHRLIEDKIEWWWERFDANKPPEGVRVRRPKGFKIFGNPVRNKLDFAVA